MKEVRDVSYSEYNECTLCARECHADRNIEVGFCGMPSDTYVSHYSLHKWEEPMISGERGSGTIFFAGCSLGCIFCQNAKISRGRNGKCVSDRELCELMLELQKNGAHNINFVTPTHYAPAVIGATSLAKERGLKVPIVYNTGSYETAETIRSLCGTVDIYLADFKYYLEKTSEALASAPDYPAVASRAIDEMFLQTGEAVIDDDGMMKRGVIVRILLLPRRTAEAKLILKHLFDRYGDKIYISLMNQYTPMKNMPQPLDRPVTREEYRSLVDYAEKLGIKNCFVQEWGTAKESFIPDFNINQ